MTAMKYKTALFASAFFLLFALAAPAFAQYPMPPRPAPQRIARVQYIDGEVSIAPEATNQWSTARLYQNLTAPEYVWTGKESRTEINVGDGFIRMNSEASVTLVNVSRNTVRIGLNQGEVNLTVPHLFPGVIYEVDTPNATLTVTKSGTYLVQVYPDQDRTVVTARRGAIVATGRGSAVTVDSGKQVVFTVKDTLQHTVMKAPPKNGFEDWASVRDQRLGVGRPPFVFGFGPWPYPPPPPPPVWVR